MCGTSLDGLDVAAVTITGVGFDATIDVTGHHHTPLGRSSQTLRALAGGTPCTAGEIAEAAKELADAHVAAIETLVCDLGEIDLIAVHGQTVHHGDTTTWQLIDPAPIQAKWSCPIATDLRRSDLAAGGEGAPITPLADWMLFRGPAPCAIVNLGGFCNITVLPAATGTIQEIQGFDLCACNQLLDAIARRDLNAPFDHNGLAAQRGTPDAATTPLLAQWLGEQAAAGQSLGSGDAPDGILAMCTVTGDDLAASATAAISETICGALARHDLGEVLVAGGGVHHHALMEMLAAHTPCPLLLTTDRGVDIEAREAAAMAILADLAWQGIPITIPEITGRGACCHIAGQWTIPAGVVLDATSVELRNSEHSHC
jgi:1,6-anhydro-N-acetylmuramate kinase